MRGGLQASSYHPFHYPDIPLTMSTLTLLKWADSKGCEFKFYLFRKVSMRWKFFGRLFGLEENELDSIEEECFMKSESCWFKVMSRWQNEGGTAEYPATWRGLLTALEDIQCHSVARELERVLSSVILPPPPPPLPPLPTSPPQLSPRPSPPQDTTPPPQDIDGNSVTRELLSVLSSVTFPPPPPPPLSSLSTPPPPPPSPQHTKPHILLSTHPVASPSHITTPPQTQDTPISAYSVSFVGAQVTRLLKFSVSLFIGTELSLPPTEDDENVFACPDFIESIGQQP